MQTIPSRFTTFAKSTFLITVTSYHDKCLAGYIHLPHYDSIVPFQNMMQLLFLMESMMDETGYPQRGMEPRVFREDLNDEATFLDRGVKAPPSGIATLRVDVLFRQNASWQGNLVWLDKKVQSHFRSALELLGLIDDALEMSIS